MAKLGLVPVAGINGVTMKKGSGRSGAIIVFNSPDVFKSPTSSTYIIFGEAKVTYSFTPTLSLSLSLSLYNTPQYVAS